MKLLLLLVLLLFLFQAPASAQNNNINMIRGKVRSAGGVPVNNAIVELRLQGAIITQTVTRNEGDFDFSSLPPAEYEVSVTASGFESTAQFARFQQSERSNFREVINLEFIVRPRPDPVQPPAGINFAQDVPKAAREAYEDGLEKLRGGKSEEGLAALRKAVGIFQDYFAANFTLAKELFRAGKDSEAIEAVERARRVNDREPAVYHLFGLIMLKERKFVVAEYAFGEAIKFNANLAPSHLFRGRALIEIAIRNEDANQRVEQFATAEKELDQAWDLSNKQLFDVYMQRARIYERRGDKEAAAKALEAYLKAEPNVPNAAQIKQAIETLRKK